MLGIYKEIPQNLLILDFTYQRPLNHTRVDKMIKVFDESLIGAVTVSRRSNGTFAVIDGQHRLAVLKAKSYSLIPCMVYPEMSVQKEAQMFADLNSCKQKNSALELFWALVGAKDKKQLEILKTIESNGFTVSKRSGGREHQKHSISAIGLVHKIEKGYGMNILDKTLEFTAKIWPGDGNALTGQLLVGLAVFINRFMHNPNFSFNAARKKFMTLTPETVLVKARNQAKIYDLDVPQIVADVLFEAYNKNLKQSNKLQWDGKTSA